MLIPNEIYFKERFFFGTKALDNKYKFKRNRRELGKIETLMPPAIA